MNAAASVEAILQLWFGLAAPPGDERDTELWLHADPAMEDEVRRRFGALVAAAGEGRLDLWVTTARSALALVLLLDQFPRLLHRGSADAYRADPRARAVCNAAIQAHHDTRLHPLEAVFLYLPLQHAENAAHQERSVQLLDALARSAPPEQREVIEQFREHARRLCSIIQRFGRFPHRNEALGRASSADEKKYLQTLCSSSRPAGVPSKMAGGGRR
jgi:uncharacterized protein (DUF924 family)